MTGTLASKSGSAISGAPLLSVTDVTKTFISKQWLLSRARAPVRAVDGISIELRQGETLGLVGETGSGKSTLGRLMLRLIDPTSGSIRFDGEDITRLSLADVRRMRSRMQMVFQDPFGSLDPRMTVRSLIIEPMIVHGYPRSEIHKRAEATMRQVGLDPLLADRYPHEFSGGQRQRIGIARAMVLDPKLLVLDEPVSALDVSIQAQILNLLRDIQKRTNIAYLFIAHDLAVVRHVSDRVAVMYLGRIVETGPRDALYGSPRHPYTISLLSAVPIPDPERERTRKRVALHGEIGSGNAVPSGCRFHPRCFRARLVAAKGSCATTSAAGATLPIACVTQVPELTPVPSGQQVACHFPDEPGTATH
jgi:oligopeptide transport system ATP-binding protein